MQIIMFGPEFIYISHICMIIILEFWHSIQHFFNWSILSIKNYVIDNRDSHCSTHWHDNLEAKKIVSTVCQMCLQTILC